MVQCLCDLGVEGTDVSRADAPVCSISSNLGTRDEIEAVIAKSNIVV